MFSLKAAFAYVMDIAFPFKDEMLPVICEEISTHNLNPQEKLELFVETALEEAVFEINDKTPELFEGVSLLKKLHSKLLFERASQPWGLYKQLLNLEIGAIEKCLGSACMKQAGEAVTGIREHGTFSAFLRNRSVSSLNNIHRANRTLTLSKAA